MTTINYETIKNAINMIRDGACQKVEIGDVKIYSCGTIIRIDIKKDSVELIKED